MALFSSPFFLFQALPSQFGKVQSWLSRELIVKLDQALLHGSPWTYAS
jgi:hypothetical protein